MDGYSGYNLIKIHPDDSRMMRSSRLRQFCYQVMLFGLKAEVTYQRAVTIKEMLGNMVECYVDDLIIKSRQKIDHLEHLRVVFDKLRQH